jgi:hypothetical protein
MARRMTAMTNLTSLEDVHLPDSYGNDVRIGDLWRDGPVVIVWLRHYG